MTKIQVRLYRRCRRCLFPQDKPISSPNSPVLNRNIPLDFDAFARPPRPKRPQYPMVVIPVDVMEELLNIRVDTQQLLGSPFRDRAVNERSDATPEFILPGSPDLFPADVMEEFLNKEHRSC